MNSSRVNFDVSFVAHLAACLDGKIPHEQVKVTSMQLRSIIEDYKTKVCLGQTIGIAVIPEEWFAKIKEETDE